MVPDKRHRHPVEKATQGSLLVLLNLTLKLLDSTAIPCLPKTKIQQNPNASSRHMLEILVKNLLEA
jgi:hypothetical protein